MPWKEAGRSGGEEGRGHPVVELTPYSVAIQYRNAGCKTCIRFDTQFPTIHWCIGYLLSME